MKRLFAVFLFLVLCGISPAQRKVILGAPSGPSCDSIILGLGPTVWYRAPQPNELEEGALYHATLDDTLDWVMDAQGNSAWTNRDPSDYYTVSGKISYAADLYKGSTDDYIAFSANVGTGDTLTLCMWLAPDNAGQANHGTVANINYGGLIVSTDDSSTNRYVMTAGTELWSTNNAWSAGVWRHVCIVKNGTTGTFYIDGALNSTGAIGSGDADGDVYIGNNDVPDSHYDGKVDDIRFYPKVLTLSEIQQIYNGGTGHQRETLSAISTNSATNNSLWQNQLKIAEWYDRSGHERHSLAAASGAFLTAIDNLENRSNRSDDLTGWVSGNSTTITSPDIINTECGPGNRLPTAIFPTSSRSGNVIGAIIGETIILKFKLKKIDWSYFWVGFANMGSGNHVGVGIDLDTCTVTRTDGTPAAIVSGPDGSGYCTIQTQKRTERQDEPGFEFSPTSGAAPYTAGAWPVCKSVQVANWQSRKPTTSSAYIAVNYVPGLSYLHFAGINGKSGFWLGDYSRWEQLGPCYDCGSPLQLTLNNIIKNNAATIFEVINPALGFYTTNDEEGFFGDENDQFDIFVDQPTEHLNLRNDDGSADTINLPVTANNTYVVEARHELGNIYLRLNGGTEVSTASGNTNNMSGLPLFKTNSGPSPSGIYYELITFDKALSTAELKQVRDCLCTDAGVTCP